MILFTEPLAKVLVGCLRACNKGASRIGPWYGVFAKRRFVTGVSSEAWKDNIMVNGNTSTRTVSLVRGVLAISNKPKRIASSRITS